MKNNCLIIINFKVIFTNNSKNIIWKWDGTGTRREAVMAKPISVLINDAPFKVPSRSRPKFHRT